MRLRRDLCGTSGADCKGSERELSNGFSVKDSPQEAFLLILLNGSGPSGSHQVSCRNFNRLRGLQLSETLCFLCGLYCLWMDIYHTFTILTYHNVWPGPSGLHAVNILYWMGFIKWCCHLLATVGTAPVWCSGYLTDGGNSLKRPFRLMLPC